MQYNLSVYGLHDNVESWACGAKVEYDLCRDEPGMYCWDKSGEHGAGTHYNSLAGYKDEYDTLALRIYDPTRIGHVMVFRDNDCRGQTASYPASADSQVI